MSPVTPDQQETGSPSDAPSTSQSGDRVTGQKKNILARIWPHKAWIVVTTLLFLLAGLAYSFTAPPHYRGTAQIFIDPSTIDSAEGKSDFSITRQIDVIQSESLLSQILKQEKDNKLIKSSQSISLNKALNILLKNDNEPESEGSQARLSGAVRTLQKSLLVSRLGNSNIVVISVTSDDPERAARLSNLIAQTYIEKYAANLSSSTGDTALPLDARIKALSAEVQKAETAVEAYRQEKGLFGDDESLSDDERLRELNNRVLTAEAETNAARARLDLLKDADVTNVLAGSSSQALTSTVVSTLRLQLADITRRETEAVAQFGDRHPSLAAIRSERESVSGLLSEELQRIVKASENDLSVAETNEEFAKKQLEDLKVASAANQEALAKLEELEDEASSLRTELDELVANAETVNDQGQSSQTTRILSKSSVPKAPFSPNMPMVMASSLFAGLTLGSLLAWIRSFFGKPQMVSRPVERRKVPRQTMDQARARIKAQRQREQELAARETDETYAYAPPNRPSQKKPPKHEYSPPPHQEGQRNPASHKRAQGGGMKQSKKLFDAIKKRTQQARRHQPDPNAQAYSQASYDQQDYGQAAYQEEPLQQAPPPPPQPQSGGSDAPPYPHNQHPYDEPPYGAPSMEERTSSLADAIRSILPEKPSHSETDTYGVNAHYDEAPYFPGQHPAYPEHLIESVNPRHDTVGHGGQVYGRDADRGLANLIARIDGSQAQHDPYASPPPPNHDRPSPLPRSRARYILRKLGR